MANRIRPARSRTITRAVVAVTLAWLANAQSVHAQADLDRLMGLLAQRKHGHVTFVEQHFLALLDRPLESSGELLYDAPDRLEKV